MAIFGIIVLAVAVALFVSWRRRRAWPKLVLAVVLGSLGLLLAAVGASPSPAPATTQAVRASAPAAAKAAQAPASAAPAVAAKSVATAATTPSAVVTQPAAPKAAAAQVAPTAKTPSVAATASAQPASAESLVGGDLSALATDYNQLVSDASAHNLYLLQDDITTAQQDYTQAKRDMAGVTTANATGEEAGFLVFLSDYGLYLNAVQSAITAGLAGDLNGEQMHLADAIQISRRLNTEYSVLAAH